MTDHAHDPDSEHEAWADTFAAVRNELIATRRPPEPARDRLVATLLDDARALVEVGPSDEAEVAHIERIDRAARALARAQRAVALRPEDDALPAKTRRMFDAVESFFQQHVGKVIAHDLVPPRTNGGADERCQRVLELVALLVHHDVYVRRELFFAAQRRARAFIRRRHAVGSTLPFVKMRDRACIDLRAALDVILAAEPEHRTVERSGVFLLVVPALISRAPARSDVRLALCA